MGGAATDVAIGMRGAATDAGSGMGGGETLGVSWVVLGDVVPREWCPLRWVKGGSAEDATGDAAWGKPHSHLPGARAGGTGGAP